MKLKEKPNSVESMLDLGLRHPFVLITVLCALLLPLGFAQAANIQTAGIIIEAVFWIAGAAALFLAGKPSSNPKVNLYLFISSAAAALIFSLMTGVDKDFSKVMFAPVLFGLAQLGVVLYRENKLTTERIVLMMIILGVVVRYCYCLTNTSVQMQHDIGTFDGKSGHLAYITYWYDNGLQLPTFNVTTRWQFYHPPLHHLLMAALLRIFTEAGMPPEQAQEAIQILPMLWSSLCMAVCFRICQLIKLNGTGMIVAMSAVCFYPTFIIWGGAYNNDMLAAFLMLLAMLWTLKWAQKPSLRNILPIALCVGCGMMTKLSAWMVAPAIAMVFLWVFIKNIKKPLPFIGQYAAFGAVCVPLGLWWGIRNLITFNIPITYVPDTKMAAMSVEKIPLGQRLFDFSFSQFSYPFEAFTMYKAPYNEYNPFMGLVKTSLFDELTHPWDFNEMATLLVIIAALLALAATAALVWFVCSKKTGVDLMTRLFFGVIFLTIIISYYIFCFQYPYVCTENIRYCIPVIPILAIAAGFGVNRLVGNNTIIK